MWNLTRNALDFFRTYVPYWEMSNFDDLTSATNDYCFAKPGEVYVVYLPQGDATELNFENYEGEYQVLWFDPKTAETFSGDPLIVSLDQNVLSIGTPPTNPNSDWAALIRKNNTAFAKQSQAVTTEIEMPTVYPNPADGSCTFTVYPAQAGETRLLITNLEMVYLDKTLPYTPSGKQTITIQTGELPDGVYSYQISYSGASGTVTESGKLLIMH
ncbi:MAG: putative collagen-binding domain-containing protein [Microscillaceae bacterium]|nr:putative collagen-binding domain-containing protein [Microscillaceae bacterium]